MQRRLIVLGASGVFGRLLVRELVAEPAPRWADLRDPDSIARLARGAFAVLCAAGPFQSFDRRCVRAAVDEGAHWLDIGDDPAWFFGLIDDAQLDARAREQHVAVIPGLSTLPAISGALVQLLGVRRLAAALECGSLLPRDVTITLGIGNRNAKGAGSIASALAGDGRTIITPDRELLRREGIDARTFVKFQLPGAALMFRLAKRLGIKPQTLSRIAAPISRFGTDASFVEAVSPNGTARVDARGQRLAILPIAIVANRLLNGLTLEGVMPPSRAIDGEELLESLRSAGCDVARTPS
jgi:hypothetical protein